MSTSSGELDARAARLCEAAIAAARAEHKSPLARDVARLSALFTTQREARKRDYMRDAALRRAYVAFYVPQYAVKVAQLLGQAEREGLWSPPPAPRVLDVGAGPLTGVLGAWIARGALGDATAVDRAAAALAAGKKLAEPLGLRVETLVASISADPAAWAPAGRVDLGIVAHVLNEIGDPRRAVPARAELLERLVARLEPGGRVLVVEPGTRVHGRALQAVRDALWQRGRASVLSPCRAAELCPLLRRPGDWCHAERPWAAPAAYAALSREAGIQKELLKDAHLLLARPEEPPPADGLRLVGGVMRDRHGVERRYGCGRHGLVTLEGKPRLAAPLRDAYRGALSR